MNKIWSIACAVLISFLLTFISLWYYDKYINLYSDSHVKSEIKEIKSQIKSMSSEIKRFDEQNQDIIDGFEEVKEILKEN